MAEIREQQLSEWTNFTAWLFDWRLGFVHSNHAESSYQTRMPNMCDKRSRRNRFHKNADGIAVGVSREKCMKSRMYEKSETINSQFSFRLILIFRLLMYLQCWTFLGASITFSHRLIHCIKQSISSTTLIYFYSQRIHCHGYWSPDSTASIFPIDLLLNNIGVHIYRSAVDVVSQPRDWNGIWVSLMANCSISTHD